MKNKLFYILTIATSVVMVSCSKKSDVTPVSAGTKFTLNGVEYTEIASADSSSTTDDGQSFNILVIAGTNGSAQGNIDLIFPGSAKPKAGVYKVSGDASSTSNAQVGIFAFDKVSIAKQGIYSATGKDNVSVTVSVSSNGKLSATFPSVALSGTNYDNTDPKNTVITDVNTTVSGSVVEN